MPWRISGSSSTLTVNSFSTPQAFRICTAFAEKPHCGNCGVPFIYRTTGLPVTCCLMRSCASMLSPQIPDKTCRKLYRPLKTRSTAPHARARARQSREVVEIGHLGVTQRDEELDAAISLVVTDRKSTRLNSSHTVISYAVFCLKKKREVMLPCVEAC